MFALLYVLAQHFCSEFFQTWIFAFASDIYSMPEWDVEGGITDKFVWVAMFDVLFRELSDRSNGAKGGVYRGESSVNSRRDH